MDGRQSLSRVDRPSTRRSGEKVALSEEKGRMRGCPHTQSTVWICSTRQVFQLLAEKLEPLAGVEPATC